MNRKYILFSICIMAAIFVFSSQDYKKTYSLSGKTTEITAAIGNSISNKYDEKFSENNNRFLDKFIKYAKNKLNSELFIRKSAHFFLYFILGICVFLSFVRLKISYAVFSILICFLYALSDEFHQKFVSGRTPSFNDIKIDTIAAAFAVILIFTLRYITYKKAET